MRQLYVPAPPKTGCTTMADRKANPFENLESAYEYVRLLGAAVEEAQETIAQDAQAARDAAADRRVEALQIVMYKLHSLGEHMRASRRLLNDLITLRRMLLGERDT